MRVQYTLKEATVTAVRQRAESLGIHPSRLVEEYLTAALRSNAAVTLTPQSPVTRTTAAQHGGPKPPTPPAMLGELTMEDIFEPAPTRPRGERGGVRARVTGPDLQKPLGEMGVDELDALDERDSARAALSSS